MLDDVKGNDNRRELLRRRLSEKKLTGSQLIAKSLKAQHITHIYGIMGVPVDDVFAACATEGLKIIGNRHQQGAILVAAAHNYISGELKAAVIVSSGPAVTNCATGFSVAFDNCWPVVVIG